MDHAQTFPCSSGLLHTRSFRSSASITRVSSGSSVKNCDSKSARTSSGVHMVSFPSARDRTKYMSTRCQIVETQRQPAAQKIPAARFAVSRLLL